jgi:hypothetical protein
VTKFSTVLKAAFGRTGCGRLASLAVLAGQPNEHQAGELSAHRAVELWPRLGSSATRTRQDDRFATGFARP